MSKAKVRVFVPLTKVDEEKRLVYGRITQEVLDKSGEVMDYESSKPNFEKWSNEIHEASGGLSKGNVRVMHGLSVAGKLTEIEFDDEDRAIDVCAKIVDDAEWNKVTEGCYTGFSVGGSYGKRWTDKLGEDKVKKFTAVPNEVSLVDNPCVPSATFSLVKADGAEEAVAFKVENDDDQWPGFSKAAGDPEEGEVEEQADPNVNDVSKTVGREPTAQEVAERAGELAKAANDGSTWQDHIEAARNELLKGEKTGDEGDEEEEAEADEGAEEAEADDDAGAAAKVTPAGVKQQWTTSDGKAFDKKDDAVAHEEALAKAAEAPEPTEADKLKARLDKALSPAPAPVETSIFSFDRAEELHKAVLELEQPRGEDGAPLLEKGMYTVSRFANMLGDVAGLARTIKAEGVLEEDSEDNAVWKTLQGQLDSFGESFMSYAKNQVAELVAGLDTDLSPRCAYDYYYRAAGEGNDLAKHVVEMIEAVEEEIPAATEQVEKLAKMFGFTDTPVESDELSPPMQKRFDDLEAENAELKKVASEAVEKVEELAKRVQQIEDTPMPRAPNPANLALREGDGNFFGKSANTPEEKVAVLTEMLKTHGPDGLALELIKASQRQPIQAVLPRGN